MKKALTPVFLILILSIQAKSQTLYQSGVMPVINYNKSLNERWKINTKLENQVMTHPTSSVLFENTKLEHRHSELHLSGTRKISYKSGITGGYMVRFHEKESYHRISQYFTTVSDFRHVVLSHRIGLDQTLKPSKDAEYRLRYRCSKALPLNGTEIDPEEGYIKLGNEYLGSLKNSDKELEIRVKAAYGYQLSNKNKAAAGLDYRIGEVAQQHQTHTLWLYMGWYL